MGGFRSPLFLLGLSAGNPADVASPILLTVPGEDRLLLVPAVSFDQCEGA